MEVVRSSNQTSGGRIQPHRAGVTDALPGGFRDRTQQRTGAGRARSATVRIMMSRSSGKQQLRGWYFHAPAAAVLPEDNCIPTNKAVVV